MWSNWPTSSRTTWAVGRVKAATVTPARLSAVPNWTIPVMVNVRVGPPKRTRTRWPTLKWYFLAVPASIETRGEVSGGRPWTMRSSEVRGSGSKFSPKVGSAPVAIGWPVRDRNWA